MRYVALIVLALLLSVSTSCATGHQPDGSDQSGAVTHVVICWLKRPGDAEQARRVIQTSKSFESIEGVRSVRVGRRLVRTSARPVDETTFDIALVMTFDSDAALQAYQSNPRHEKAVREVLRPMTSKILVYDFTAE